MCDVSRSNTCTLLSWKLSHKQHHFPLQQQTEPDRHRRARRHCEGVEPLRYEETHQHHAWSPEPRDAGKYRQEYLSETPVAQSGEIPRLR